MTALITSKELQELKELAGKATPGDREIVTSKRARSKWAKVIVRESDEKCTLYSEWSGKNYLNDAEFNAAAKPDKVLALIAQLERAVAVIKKCELITVTDGCDECSRIWQREYELRDARDFLKEIDWSKYQ